MGNHRFAERNKRANYQCSRWRNNSELHNSYPVSAITLSTPITVDGVFTLTDGHLMTDATNILTLSAGASVSLNAPVTQDSSFVKGPMIHTKNTTGAETKVFPVGKNNRMHRADLALTHAATTSTQYTGEFINSSAAALGWTLPTSPDTINMISNYNYWEISKGGGSLVNTAAVTLYYFSGDSVTDPPNLRIVKGNPTAWIDIGGTGTAAPNGTIASTINFTTFSKFALGNKKGGVNPLPVEFLSLTGEPDGNIVNVKWTTATEFNSDYFIVQHSKDGNDFEDIDKVKAAGSSTTIRNYSSVDYEPYQDITYYRLKQFDKDGKYAFSDMIAVKLKMENSIAVYPNPANGPFNVSIKANSGDNVLIVVRDVQGKEFYSKVVILANDKEVIAVDPEGKLSSGVYMVVASSNDNIYEKK